MKEKQAYDMDKLLRQRLRNGEAPVPGDLWQRIEAARKPKRDPLPLWAGLSLLVVVTAGMAFWMSLSDTSSVSGAAGSQPDQPQVRTIPAAVIGAKEGGAEVGVSVSGSTADEGREASRVEVQATATSSTGSKQMNAPSMEAHRASGSSKTSEGSATGNTSTSKSVKAEGRTAPTQKLKRPAKQLEKGKAVPSKPTADSGEGYDGAGDDFALSGEPAPGSQGSTNKEITEGAAGPLLFLRDRGTQRIDEASLDLHGLLGSPAVPTRVPACYSFQTALRGLSVDLYAAPAYAVRQMVYRDDATMAHAKLRNDTERYAFAYSTGFRASAHFRGGLALRTGLTYTDIMERFRTNDPDADITRVITIQIDTIFEGPSPVIKIDTLSIIEYGQRDKVDLNHYRFVDIPLIVGYEMDRGRWFLSMNAGLLFNLATAQRGTILAMDGSPISIDSEKAGAQHPYKTRVGSSFQLGMGLNYALAPRLHLLLEPQFRVWLKPLNVASYPIDHKYVNAGLAIGIRRYL